MASILSITDPPGVKEPRMWVQMSKEEFTAWAHYFAAYHEWRSGKGTREAANKLLAIARSFDPSNPHIIGNEKYIRDTGNITIATK
jgi:hypothetical protein